MEQEPAARRLCSGGCVDRGRPRAAGAEVAHEPLHDGRLAVVADGDEEADAREAGVEEAERHPALLGAEMVVELATDDGSDYACGLAGDSGGE